MLCQCVYKDACVCNAHVPYSPAPTLFSDNTILRTNYTGVDPKQAFVLLVRVCFCSCVCFLFFLFSFTIELCRFLDLLLAQNHYK